MKWVQQEEKVKCGDKACSLLFDLWAEGQICESEIGWIWGEGLRKGG